MSELPKELTTDILDLQRKLIVVINKATKTAFIILNTYGETDDTLISLDDLDNIRERANSYYSKFSTLLLRIAESQPLASQAMLELLQRVIEQAQATMEASEATIREEKQNWNLL
ncbi:hypothetical protein IQ225_16720 [Synechocystis salina LEGE 06155]|nr:hypothetical protein [Synechocystis salina LEGE 06155]